MRFQHPAIADPLKCPQIAKQLMRCQLFVFVFAFHTGTRRSYRQGARIPVGGPPAGGPKKIGRSCPLHLFAGGCSFGFMPVESFRWCVFRFSCGPQAVAPAANRKKLFAPLRVREVRKFLAVCPSTSRRTNPPKAPQRTPRIPKDSPKSPQRHLKGNPGIPKGAPKSPQRSLRRSR